jgi:acetyl esterase
MTAITAGAAGSGEGSGLDSDVRRAVEQAWGAWHGQLGRWTPEELRRGAAEELAVAFGPSPEVYEIADLATDGGVRFTVIKPTPLRRPFPAIVFFHGGGFTIGSRATYTGMTRTLALGTNAAVLSVEYRLAPENPFPAAVEDAWAAVQWLVSEADALGLDRDRIAVAGDSAGGNLAAVIARRCRDVGLALAAQLLLYPVVDFVNTYPSQREFAEGYSLDEHEARWFLEQYLGDSDPSHPDISPALVADLKGLAPAIVVTAGCDVLRDEAEAYARRLAEAGVRTETRRFPGMPHAFLNYYKSLQTVRAAYAEISDLLSDFLAV